MIERSKQWHKAGRLLVCASGMALALGIASQPAHAQLSKMRGGGTSAATVVGGATGGARTVQRSAAQRDALSRAVVHRERVARYRTQLQQAAAAVTASNITPENGLIVDEARIAQGNANALVPVAGIRSLIRQRDAGDAAGANRSLVNFAAALDTDAGLNTWQGAGLPTQTVAADGKTEVTIAQTQSRALLSWDQFDVGADTRVNFTARTSDGTTQPRWVAVNRVVGAADRTDPTAILGEITGDQQVFILDPRGIIFGPQSQVNLRSLVASSLDLGANFAGGSGSTVSARSLKDRNTAFIDSGLPSTGTFLSARLASIADAASTPISGLQSNFQNQFEPVTGSVVVESGAQLFVDGGYLLLAAPVVRNAGVLAANNGQVSLQGGQRIEVAQSTGTAAAGGEQGFDPINADADIRGFIFNTRRATFANPNVRVADATDGLVDNSGYVFSRRGYVSLAAGQLGEVVSSGLVEATTSVNRNGKIVVRAGSVTIGDGSANAHLVILPDEDGSTVGIGGPTAPNNFRQSEIEIGFPGFRVEGRTDRLQSEVFIEDGIENNGIVNFLANSLLLAPGADVSIIGNGSAGAGAIFDVSGEKLDVLDFGDPSLADEDRRLDLSRFQLTLPVLKRNELRDTPNYREQTFGDGFTLNGQTVTVDVRQSGVRSDGVRWLGSPLVEAESLAAQIQVGATELMTEGGAITFEGAGSVDGRQDFAFAPSSIVDVSGGWKTYRDGVVATTRLVTASGRIVDIADADPNDVYVDLLDPFVDNQPRFQIGNSFNNPVISRGAVETGYDEGSRGGRVDIDYLELDGLGIVLGHAFAGRRQLSGATLPAGGELTVETNRAITVYGGPALPAQLSANGSLLLQDATLNGSGLGSIRLEAGGSLLLTGQDRQLAVGSSGSIAVDRADLVLSPGAEFTFAGAGAQIDGNITAPGGSIAITTTATSGAFSFGDLTDRSAADAFDLVLGGNLSAAGLFTNDFLNSSFFGSAFRNGGTISLTGQTQAIEALAGIYSDIVISPQSVLDVSAGAYVGVDRSLALDAEGGTIALRVLERNQPASLITDYNPLLEEEGVRTAPYIDFAPRTIEVDGEGGRETIEVDAEGRDPAVAPRLVFDAVNLRAFGFESGGSLDVAAPDITFNGEARLDGVGHVGLDFLARTGFGEASFAHARVVTVEGLFERTANGVVEQSGFSNFAATATFSVQAGERLDLTQTLLPQVLSAAEISAVAAATSGARVTELLQARVPADLFDQRGASLTLGGRTEFVVEAGGQLDGVTGGPGAVLAVSELLNRGNIRLPGGAIVQSKPVGNNGELGIGSPSGELNAALAGFFGASRGADENAVNILGTTNADLFFNQPFTIYIDGVISQSSGIVLAPGSVTDLSGTILYDPRAPFLGQGRQQRIASVLDGGALLVGAGDLQNARAEFGNTGIIVQGDSRLVVEAAVGGLPAARLDLSGPVGETDVVQRGLRSGLSQPAAFASSSIWGAGGTLGLFRGGDTADLAISAAGGLDRASGLAEAGALGGTLALLSPTIEFGNPSGGGSNGVRASLIEASGFDTLVTAGTVTFDGDGTLSLDRAFLHGTIDLGRLTGLDLPNVVDVARFAATAGTTAFLSAPIVRIDGFAQNAVQTVSSNPLRFTEADDRTSLTITATALGIDVFGGLFADGSINALELRTPGDIRLVGKPVTAQTGAALLAGIQSIGDLTLTADRIYAATGTGSYQSALENNADPAVNAARIFASGAGSTITITGNGSTEAPLSAGSALWIQASRIYQNGSVFAPFGFLRIGGSAPVSSANGLVAPATDTLVFGPAPVGGDVLATPNVSVTSVSGNGLSVPYGTTTDLLEYFFAPSGNSPLTATPTGALDIGGGSISVGDGAYFDLRGGGELFAFEFIPGIGGSRDVLDRFNADLFSSNDFDAMSRRGLQFADGRQVFAIVPQFKGGLAPFDPIYSADFNGSDIADIYGLDAGLSVTLDASSLLPAGEYLLLPGHYALLPGALRVVENVGQGAPIGGETTTLLDGTVQVGGFYSLAGGNIADPVRLSFALQSAETFLKASRIETTGIEEPVLRRRELAERPIGRLPVDAGRLSIRPLMSFALEPCSDSADTTCGFDTEAATGARGFALDFVTQNLVIGELAAGEDVGDRFFIDDAVINSFNAESLLLGGSRRELDDGRTLLAELGANITIRAGERVQAGEVILAVGGDPRDSFAINPLETAILIESGAALVGVGTIGDRRTSDLVVGASLTNLFDPNTGEQILNPITNQPEAIPLINQGAFLRVANGPTRLLRREGIAAATLTSDPSFYNADDRITVSDGLAALQASNVTIEYGEQLLFGSATIAPSAIPHSISLLAPSLRFGGGGLDVAIADQFGQAQSTRLISGTAIGLESRSYAFNDLSVEAPGIVLLDGGAVQTTIDATTFRLTNPGAAQPIVCPVTACGSADAALAVNATDAILAGSLALGGFRGGVTFDLDGGLYVAGPGALSLDDAPLILRTALITDVVPDLSTLAGNSFVRTDFTFASAGGIRVDGADKQLPARRTGQASLGSRVRFSTETGPGAAVTDIRIADTVIALDAGSLAIEASGDAVIDGSTRISLPGRAVQFGDALDRVEISAPGGELSLVSAAGDISVAQGVRIELDSGIGNPGSLRAVATAGSLGFAADLPTLGGRFGSLTIDAGANLPGFASFDIDSFVSTRGTLGADGRRMLDFQGSVDIRMGGSAIGLSAINTIRAESVRLVADGGTLSIAGTIDTSGVDPRGLGQDERLDARVNGGDVALYGRDGVAILDGAAIRTGTPGYLAAIDTRVASAGDLTIGVASLDARIAIGAGAAIDVSAERTDARFVSYDALNPAGARVTTWRYVEGDDGGTVRLRLPVSGRGGDYALGLDLPSADPFGGAAGVQIEAFAVYDLDSIGEGATIPGLARGPRDSSGSDVWQIDLAAGLDPSSADYLTDNFLATRFTLANGQLSPVQFIQDFRVAGLDSLQANEYRVRPGVDLVSDGGIEFASNLNLAAAHLSDSALAEAIDPANGILTAIDQLSQPGGTVTYGLVPGKEQELLALANFYYRVGGRYLAGDAVGGSPVGEAAIFNFRAGGNFQLGTRLDAATADSRAYGISDGFFVFRDLTDQDFVDYQLGGGIRAVAPAIRVSCRIGGSSSSCDGGEAGADVLGPAQTTTINLVDVVGLDLARFTPAPFRQLANSPAALGSRGVLAGEAEAVDANVFAVATLFANPVATTGVRAHSSDVRIVAGSAASADPAAIDRARSADLIISGETEFRVEASGRPTGRTVAANGSPLQLYFEPGDSGNLEGIFQPDPVPALSAGLIEALIGNGNQDISPEFLDAVVRLNFGTVGNRSAVLTELADEAGIAPSNRTGLDAERASGFFAFTEELSDLDQSSPGGGKPRAVAIGTPLRPTGVYARFSDIIAFLDSTEGTGGSLTRGQRLAADIAGDNVQLLNTATASVRVDDAELDTDLNPTIDVLRTVNRGFYGGLVRTGDGALSLSASRDVSLVRTTAPVFRDSFNRRSLHASGTLLVGSAPVYTAGVSARGAALAAAAGVEGQPSANLSFRPDATQSDDGANYIPNPFLGILPTTAAMGGGDVAVRAGRDLVQRRDAQAELTSTADINLVANSLGERNGSTLVGRPALEATFTGRSVTVPGLDGSIASSAFRGGIAALAGGDVSIAAGGSLIDPQVVLASINGVANPLANMPASFVAEGTDDALVVTVNHGDLRLDVGGDLLGGRLFVSRGIADLDVRGAIVAGPALERVGVTAQPSRNLLEIEFGDVRFDLQALGQVSIGNIGDLLPRGIPSRLDLATPYIGTSAIASLRIFSFADVALETRSRAIASGVIFQPDALLAPSLYVTSLGGSLSLDSRLMLLPSANGQLEIFAGADLDGISIAMLDNVLDLNGAASASDVGGSLWPTVLPTTSELELRARHDPLGTHADDETVARIFSLGTLRDLIVDLPKASRLYAGEDIIDAFFIGQHTQADSVTRIVAGRDIRATLKQNPFSTTNPQGSFLAGNNFVFGGPGDFILEAGRDLGPFINSAIPASSPNVAYAGGVRTVGAEYNPWLSAAGGNLQILFGVAPGIETAALRDAYLDPANFAELDGDLFLPTTDAAGNIVPQRELQLYVPLLADWLRENAAADFATIVAGAEPASAESVAVIRDFLAPEFARQAQRLAGDPNAAPVSLLTERLYNPAVAGGDLEGAVDFAARSFGQVGGISVAQALYESFSDPDVVPELAQRRFLFDTILKNEVAETARPNGPSLNQYLRGYRAIQTLFPAGTPEAPRYTDNLSAYDLTTGLRRIEGGAPVIPERVLTGSMDLRLATIQTARGGDITIVAPGGDLQGGSVVRSSEQAARRLTAFGGSNPLANGIPASFGFPTADIPLSFEGLLTLRGGDISVILDGNLLLNQSRLFTLAGGEITAWSSVADVNAGQGPRSASSVPLTTLRFDQNGAFEVDTGAAISGAGIGTFRRTESDPTSDIALIAPVGEVDAGDAGVRSSGSVFVAAARVANADAFQAAGSVSGVPGVNVAPPPAVVANEVASVASEIARQTQDTARNRAVSIVVEILGYAGGSKCRDLSVRDADCPQ